jgi:5-hydroxyisourate hydrolase
VTALSTHVLDAVTGCPAVGVPVRLSDSDGTMLAESSTDSDGRVRDLGDASGGELAGTYRLRFDTAVYFAAQGVAGFYPEIVVTFEIADPAGKYHVPVLLSPYAYATYRGS